MALSAWLDMPQRAFRGGTRSGASNENWKCRWERPRDPDDMVGAAGIEPATLGLEIRCSIRLSYAPALINTGEEAHCRNLRSLIAMPAVRIAHPTRPLPVGPSRARINLAWRSMRCSRDVIRLP